MDRVRRTVKDKRVLALVKAFLKAGVLTELVENEETHTGTPHGGICPRCWPTSRCRCSMSSCTAGERQVRRWVPRPAARRRRKGLPNWRIVRYADDFVILVHGTRDDVVALCADVATALIPLGLRLSESKAQVVHMSDGFDFLGFHIQWKRKYGSNKWHVYTFIADRPIRSLKAKVRALTRRTSQQNPGPC